MMATTNTKAQNGRASTIKTTFSRETSVSIGINADAAIAWALLTNAADYPRWNSTILTLDGKIAAGEKIRLTSTLDPKRTFKLRVKEFIPTEKLVWGDSMGKRVYTLAKHPNGQLAFTMREKIGGPLFPLFANMIPPFDSSFEQFAADLKKESELIMRAR